MTTDVQSLPGQGGQSWKFTEYFVTRILLDANSETTEAGPGYRVTAFCWWFKKVNKLFINPSEGLIIITSHKMNS